MAHTVIRQYLQGQEPLYSTSRRDPLLLNIPTGPFSGQSRVCYEETNARGQKSWNWYKATVRINGSLRGTATFETGGGEVEVAPFSFLEDEAVPETTPDHNMDPGEYIDHVRAAVVFTQDLRTGLNEKWLYPEDRNLMEFCVAVNDWKRRRGLSANLYAPPSIRAETIRELASIEAEQERAQGVVQGVSGQGVHILYTSNVPRCRERTPEQY